jgi:hypothetical protein
MKRVVELATLVHEGIDAARIPLDPLVDRSHALGDPRLCFAVEKVLERIVEAELWLGRVVELSALQNPDLEVLEGGDEQ